MDDEEKAMLERWARLRGAQVAGSEEEVLSEAESRIERHRKGDGLVRVVDGKGEPVAGAQVRVEQVRHAFLFGCNAFPLLSYEEQAMEAAYERQFAALVNCATLGFYWGAYERRPGKTIAERLRDQARWCRDHSMSVKGHPLVWHEVYPKWGPSDAEETRRALQARVTEIVSGFAGLVDCWDVVNEASVSAGFDNGVGNWAKRDGAAALVKEALGWAREANPGALLLYNDYNYWPPEYGYEKLAAELVGEQSPVDAFGLQSHWHHRERSIPWMWELCETYARFGKPLHFTEVTVLSGEHGWARPAPWPTTPEGEARQADYVERSYTALFSHPAVEAIIWWDFMDGAWQGAPAGLVRADLSPKPVYDRLLGLVRGKWWTRTEARTQPGGTLRFRGFLGKYRITAMTAAGEATKEMALERGGANEMQVAVE